MTLRLLSPLPQPEPADVIGSTLPYNLITMLVWLGLHWIGTGTPLHQLTPIVQVHTAAPSGPPQPAPWLLPLPRLSRHSALLLNHSEQLPSGTPSIVFFNHPSSFQHKLVHIICFCCLVWLIEFDDSSPPCLPNSSRLSSNLIFFSLLTGLTYAYFGLDQPSQVWTSFF